jgi:protein arginine kinase activator
MKCDRCGKEASITVKAIINGRQHDFHLCNDCLKEYKNFENLSQAGGRQAININDIDWRSLVEKMIPSLDDVIDGYYEYKFNKNNYGFDYIKSMNQKTCPVCGNLKNNIRLGIFGCPNCYTLNSKATKKVLKAKNNFSQYKGKYPRKHRDFHDLAIQIKTLQEKLQQSVATEDFEQAQNLKDQIDELNMKVRN